MVKRNYENKTEFGNSGCNSNTQNASDNNLSSKSKRCRSSAEDSMKSETMKPTVTSQYRSQIQNSAAIRQHRGSRNNVVDHLRRLGTCHPLEALLDLTSGRNLLFVEQLDAPLPDNDNTIYEVCLHLAAITNACRDFGMDAVLAKLLETFIASNYLTNRCQLLTVCWPERVLELYPVSGTPGAETTLSRQRQHWHIIGIRANLERLVCILYECMVRLPRHRASTELHWCSVKECLKPIEASPCARDVIFTDKLITFKQRIENRYETDVLLSTEDQAISCTDSLRDGCLVAMPTSQHRDNSAISLSIRPFAKTSTCNQRRLQRNLLAASVWKGDDEQAAQSGMDGFRNIQVIPTLKDIIGDPKERRLLRPNIAKGKYASVNHYLDTQFRLLREDFIRPLREGLTEYASSQGNVVTTGPSVQKTPGNIRLFERVSVAEPFVSDNSCELVNEVHFDTAGFGGVVWKTSKQLMFGSLVCLSLDRFQSTMWFGTVCDRQPEELKNGNVTINFGQHAHAVATAQKRYEKEKKLGNSGPYQPFVMAESVAFFEAYRPVLRALQNFREEQFPFSRYFVFGDFPNMPPPPHDNSSEFELSSILLETPTTTSSLETCDLLDLSSWPAAEEFGFDDSQYAALQLALTSELAIIQGPPGTGKTYLGSKIVQVLLGNSRKNSGPILLVCYTNHALDSFLESTLKFTSPRNVIRVGGGSKSEALKECLLPAVRKRSPRCFGGEIAANRHTATTIQDQLNELDKKVTGSHGNIQPIKKLQRFIPDCQRASLYSGAPETSGPDDVLMSWLMDIDAGSNPSDTSTQPHAKDNHIPNARADNTRTPDPGPFALLASRNQVHDMNVSDSTEDNHPASSDAAVLDQRYDFLRDNIDTEVLEERKTDGIKDSLVKQNGCGKGSSDGLIDENNNNIIRIVSRSRPMVESNTVRSSAIKVTLEPSGLNPRNREWKQTLVQLINDNRHVRTEEQARDEPDLWALDRKDRWAQYRYWLAAYQKEMAESRECLVKKYKEAVEKLNGYRILQDMRVLRSAKLIGMTTSGAARYQKTLQQIEPTTVIIEEAAEVLEAHIMTSLSPDLRHLILIGDHHQLRPNPAVYDLAVNYNLEISLFERLINNGCHHACLKLQHRMRPEISRPLMPHFYAELRDHASVNEYESISGVTSSICFIKHSVPENMDNPDSTSHKNSHEAQFVAALGLYFIQQGYDPSQITILTPYMGQLFEIKGDLRAHSEGKGIRASLVNEIKVTSVDNYQGEENDIIILSLVRSTMAGKGNRKTTIGFMGQKNRVCVALSRAKRGLFVVGNFDLFAAKKQFWADICTSVSQNDDLRSKLSIQCAAHGKIVQVRSGTELRLAAPDGGCQSFCMSRLICGHRCQLHCHPYDPNHRSIICAEPCGRLCTSAPPNCKPHVCKSMCADCWVPKANPDKTANDTKPTTITNFVNACKPCTQPVDRILSRCGHSVRNVPCSENERHIECQTPCDAELECGHQCQKLCHTYDASHTVTCQIMVTKRREPCGHNTTVTCHRDPGSVPCKERCNRSCTTAPEGELAHPCITNCADCATPNACKPCQQPVDRIVDKCGHIARKVPCSQPKEEVKCQQRCIEPLPCGHRCHKACHAKDSAHTIHCNELVHKMRRPCWHKVISRCHMDPNDTPCPTRMTKSCPGCGRPIENVQCSEDPQITECPTRCNGSREGLRNVLNSSRQEQSGCRIAIKRRLSTSNSNRSSSLPLKRSRK